MIKFSKSHEWAKIEGDTAAIGISDYAQESLGDVVFLELPKIGAKVKKETQFGTIESTKAASELFSPLSGEVLEINKDAVNSPQIINEDPLNKGWMLKIKISDKKEIDSLMDETVYNDFVSKEQH